MDSSFELCSSVDYKVEQINVYRTGAARCATAPCSEFPVKLLMKALRKTNMKTALKAFMCSDLLKMQAEGWAKDYGLACEVQEVAYGCIFPRGM